MTQEIPAVAEDGSAPSLWLRLRGTAVVPILAVALLAALSLWAVLSATASVLDNSELLPASDFSTPKDDPELPASQVDGANMDSPSSVPEEHELPGQPAPSAEEARQELEARIRTAAANPSADIRLSFIYEALDEDTLLALLGDNYVQPAWRGMVNTGQCSLLVWGLAGEGTLPVGSSSGTVRGLGGEDLYTVVGLSLNGESVDMLAEGRTAFTLPKQWFFQRLAEIGFYVRVDSVQLDVPYLSQLDYGLARGCEVTSLTMMFSFAQGRTNNPLDPTEMAALMTYSTNGSPATGYVGNPYSDGWTTYMEPQMDFVASQTGSAVNLTNQVTPASAVSELGGIQSSMARIRAHLAQGVPVVALFSGYATDNAYYFETGYTHAMVITGYTEDGFTLHDPFAIHADVDYSHMLYPADDVYSWILAHDFRAISY